MERTPQRVHLIGFGNPGRLDDGLGPALAAAIERLQLPVVSVDSDYQLTVDDAYDMAGYDVVIFADADIKGREPFYFEPVASLDAGIAFSSHGCSPQEVVGLARQLFGGPGAAYLIGIRGYEWDAFEERLSTGAQANLEAATAFIVERLRQGDFEKKLVPNQ